MAKRIQRKRTKGWKMPANSIYVGRPTIFGNPFVVGGMMRWTTRDHTPYLLTLNKEWAIELFRVYLHCPAVEGWQEHKRLELLKRIYELRGKDLACWCPLDQPCHADVLLEIANQ